MLKSVEANVLDENIQAVNEAASGRIPALTGCGGGGNRTLLNWGTAPA
jgi:hypothetical protein